MLNKHIYASIENRPFSSEELAELAIVSARNNQQQEITGYLFYRYGIFFQYLEGPAESLNRRMASIQGDERHTIINTFTFAPSDHREFPNWSMQLFDLRSAAANEVDGRLEELLLRLQQKDFSRFEESDSESVLCLLQEIARRELG